MGDALENGVHLKERPGGVDESHGATPFGQAGCFKILWRRLVASVMCLNQPSWRRFSPGAPCSNMPGALPNKVAKEIRKPKAK